MLRKIILKNFRSNVKTYILFFVSNMFAVVELFIFWGLNDMVKDLITEKVTALALKIDFGIAAGVIAFITVCLMVFSMKCYIQLRIKDYTTFIVLGMKKKTTYLLLLSEYSIGCIAALILGMTAGSTGLNVTARVLHLAYPDFFEIRKTGFIVYRDVAGVSLMIMAIVFIILLVWMDGRDLSVLMSQDVRNEKRPASPKWIGMIFLGLAVMAFGEVLYQGSDLSYIYSHIVWAAGLFLTVAFGTAMILNPVQKKEKFYFRHIISLNQLYSRYQNNLFIMAILLTVHFFALTYLTVQIAALLPLDQYREDYPYDMIWIARETDDWYSRELAEQFDGEVTSFPMVRVTTAAGAQHIGLSAASYEELAGKRFDLEGRKIVVEVGNSDYKKEAKIEDKDFWEAYSVLFVGTEFMDEEIYPPLRDKWKEAAFSIQELYSKSTIGQYSVDLWHENIIVFSDDYFDEQWKKARVSPDEASALKLFTFPKGTRDKAFRKLSAYNEKNGVPNKNSTQNESSLYETEGFLTGQKMRAVFSLCSKLFLMAALLFGAFFAAGLKILTELSSFKRRYEFLRCMGMKKKIRRKCIGFEVRLLHRISIGAALFMAGIYMVSFVYKESIYHVEQAAGKNVVARVISAVSEGMDKEFLRNWLLLMAGYVLVNSVVQGIFARYVAGKVQIPE